MKSPRRSLIWRPIRRLSSPDKFLGSMAEKPPRRRMTSTRDRRSKAMLELAERKPKTIKAQGPDHPITIERNAHRVVVKVAGRAFADTRQALTLRQAGSPPVQSIP